MKPIKSNKHKDRSKYEFSAIYESSNKNKRKFKQPAVRTFKGEITSKQELLNKMKTAHNGDIYYVNGSFQFYKRFFNKGDLILFIRLLNNKIAYIYIERSLTI